MPRIVEGRVPARPQSPQQQERVRRILRAAARQGAENGLDRVQMHEIAKESGVAIATLYRYFPSKMHLFTLVMRDRVERMSDSMSRRHPSNTRVANPVQAITDLLIASTIEMMKAPLLAQAMMISNNAALHASPGQSTEAGEAFAGLLLSTAGIDQPTARDLQLVRLIEQSWYGVINSGLNQHTPIERMQDDIQVSCELLLREWNDR